ncbi:MAG TPA: alpha/beta fold hydrolase [Actinomycetota bacterium]|jgi:haloalkane dehalogenase|nr:alpha/beta fold hydrolase [Actinomycetota bacterium]
MAPSRSERPIEQDGRRPSWLPAAEYPFESRFVDLDGHLIHYVDEGSGPTLLFVVAGAAWSFVFGPVIERLRGHFRCVALDLPGSGLSVPAEGYEPGIEAACSVLERFVLELDLRDVTLVVHDLGGVVALGVAARHPELVRGMTVIETFGWPISEENPKVARMLRMVSGRAFRGINGATNVLAGATSTGLGVGRHLSRAGRKAFRGPFRDREVRRAALLMLRDATVAVAYLRGVDRSLTTTLHDRPLLLVFGGKSPVRKEGFPDQWTARFPEARLVVVEGAHHFPHMDEPDLVAEAIRSWWSERVAPPTTAS